MSTKTIEAKFPKHLMGSCGKNAVTYAHDLALIFDLIHRKIFTVMV